MTPAKRLLDLFFALLLVGLLGPVMLGLLAWLWIKQGRPLFYVAERMKTADQPFMLWKLRTMTVVDADAGVSGGDKAQRITPQGAWLRAKRLDEFPQLWNIIRGDLSFVGPRPPLREYVERFPEIYREVLKSRPGVTGLATIVYHKHETTLLERCATPEETDAVYARSCVPRKARLDLIYQKHRNICVDFDIVFQTIGNLIRRGRQTALLPASAPVVRPGRGIFKKKEGTGAPVAAPARRRILRVRPAVSFFFQIPRSGS